MRHKFILIHPGTQHAWQLANAACLSGKFKSVHLFTGFLITEKHPLSRFRFFRKRVRQLHPAVHIHNRPFIAGCLLLHQKLLSLAGITHHNAAYSWQILFNWLLYPVIFLNRQCCVLALFETAGWPLSKCARQWGIPVIMDFPSFSHEEATFLGIPETKLGTQIKYFERQYIHYGFFCSALAERSYHGRTSATQHFIIPPGYSTFGETSKVTAHGKHEIRLACIANTEIRKGLDILLLAYAQITHPKKLYLIGNLNKRWVKAYCRKYRIDHTNIYLTGPLLPQAVRQTLLSKQIDLHILPSRFDAFGMVVPETMSLGILNILSPAVGAGELLTDGRDVLRMPRYDTGSLLEKISHYLALSPENKEQLKQQVLLKAREMTWAIYYQKAAAAFSVILNDFPV